MTQETSPPRVRGTLGLIAAASAVAGPALAWLRLVPGIVGFGLFALGGLTAVVVSLVSLVQALRGRAVGLGHAAAMVTGVVFVLLALRGAGVPAINDFSTDLADPPAFRHAGTLSPNLGRDLGYPQSFAATQRACCADLHPARVPLGKVEAFTRVRRFAEHMPAWTVTHADADAGTIEAVATSRVFGFHDDLVIRIRQESDGTSRVDMRSKSRDGKGDLGVNAARIRAFIAGVEAAG